MGLAWVVKASHAPNLNSILPPTFIQAFYRTRCRASGLLLALDEGSGLLVPPLARAVPGTWQELLAGAFDLERVEAYHLPYLSMRL